MSTHPIKEGEKAAKAGMLHLIILGSIKLAAGLVTGMTVIIADAISTFADILGVFASYIGLKLSRKNADEHFEYGYYKIETLAALVISVGIIYVGYLIFRNSLSSFGEVREAKFRSFAITTTVIAIISSYILAKKLKIAGEKSNSLSLIASAKDKKMDMLAGVAVLISIIANYQKIPYVEGIVSIIIALLILKVGLLSSKESLFFLLDYWNDPTLSRKIRALFRKEKDLILRVKKLRLRRAGTYIFGQAFVEINPFAGIQDLREEMEIMQRKIKELNPYIKDFEIYSHIPRSEKEIVALPIKGGNNLNAEIATKLSHTKAYMFVEIRGDKIGKFYIKKLEAGQKKPVQLSNFLKDEKVDILIDNDLNSLLYFNLRRTHHILIYPNFSDIKNVESLLKVILLDT